MQIRCLQRKDVIVHFSKKVNEDNKNVALPWTNLYEVHMVLILDPFKVPKCKSQLVIIWVAHIDPILKLIREKGLTWFQCDLLAGLYLISKNKTD